MADGNDSNGFLSKIFRDLELRERQRQQQQQQPAVDDIETEAFLEKIFRDLNLKEHQQQQQPAPEPADQAEANEELNLDAILADAVASWHQQGHRHQSVIPERPRLTAETTEAYVRSNEELEVDEEHETELWRLVHVAEQKRHDTIECIQRLAFHGTGAISPAELQALLVRYGDETTTFLETLANLETFHGDLTRNRQPFFIQTVDVLAHRDPQHALLRPGQPMKVPVGTPTEGPRVTDEDALLRDYGVDLGM